VHLTVTGPAGPLEALLDEPRPADGTAARSPRAAVAFAHPHPQQGGTMHTKAVYQGAKGLARVGCAVLRFNFRGVGASAGAFDEGRGERDDFTAVVAALVARYPGVPIWAAGFSFGAWVALEQGALDPRVSLLIGIAPPVTREGYTFEAIYESEKPKFLVQGSLDEVCPVRDLWAFYARLKEPKEIVLIDGANHLFEGQAGEVGEALESLLGDLE
jgi:alpha/beta superfamily hydrolase